MRLLTDDAVAISDGSGLTRTPLRYTSARRIAAVARAGFTAAPAKRRPTGGPTAIHHAVADGASAFPVALGDMTVDSFTFDIAGGRTATMRGIAPRLIRLTQGWRRQEPETPLIAPW
ncbi:hypothetical protein [Streptomyces sp. NPDC006879]|uniref:hypothetical protein n=1 Tax=Streptomyces sp. NPDC006879 TaxID=3364767 RepID=UPI0036CABD51